MLCMVIVVAVLQFAFLTYVLYRTIDSFWFGIKHRAVQIGHGRQNSITIPRQPIFFCSLMTVWAAFSIFFGALLILELKAVFTSKW